MTDRFVTVNEELLVPREVFLPLAAEMRVVLVGAEWLPIPLKTGITSSSVSPAMYRVTGVGPDRKLEFRGAIVFGSSGITSVANLVWPEGSFPQQYNIYGVALNGAANVRMHISNSLGLVMATAPASGATISLDGIAVYF